MVVDAHTHLGRDEDGQGLALERIDALLAGAEQLIGEGGEQATLAFGLVMAASVIAATEPVDNSQPPPAVRRQLIGRS